MSYLQNQLSAFKSSVSSSSAKIANKRTVNAVPDRTSTPPLSSQNSRNDLKRRRPEENVTYSQPANTGVGQNIMSQIHFAVGMLKEKKTPQTFEDIIDWLSVGHQGNEYRRTIGTILMSHEKVEYRPKEAGKEATFRYRPKHNIRSKDSLLGFLQSQRTAQGLNAKDLRDGWPESEAAIRELENEGKLLVTRNKKDDHAKMVWINDSSLSYHIDDEFQAIWQTIRLPEPKTLIEELEQYGLTPANKSKALRKPVKQETKKTRKTRKGGKTTNTHMAGVLRDFSHLTQ